MGIVTQRQRKRRAAQTRKKLLMMAATAGMMALLAASPQIRHFIRSLPQDIQVFSQEMQLDMTLPECDVYALQLAVFDNGERAGAEAKRLQSEGVRCVIWQRTRMRIVVSAALSRDQLDMGAAKGYEAYIIQDKLPEISLRLSAQENDAVQAKRLLEAPDAVFVQLLNERETPMTQIVDQTRALAAQTVHPENALYTQLAKNLVSWCDLMEKTLEEAGEDDARSYGAVTMCTLCRELRQALSMLSTASAQRTPSTAAEVMPPAYPAPSPQG